MNIVDLISQWVSRSNDLKISEIYSDYGLTQYHYFTEIVRYWNHLNFIAKKTLRSLPKGSIKDSKQIEVYLYLTYRYFWEKAEFPDILLEIKTSQTEYNPKLLLSFYTKLSTFDWDIALQNKSKSDQLSIKYAIPSFTVNTLLPVMDLSDIKRNIKAMDEGARRGIFYLRTNHISTIPISNQISSIMEDLDRIGVKSKPDNEFPSILQINVKDKSKVLKSNFYKEKRVTIQDKASYAAIQLLDPQPEDKICDFCAAPGMKTSLIAHQTKNQAFIVAGDFHHYRTNEMASVLRSFRVTNTHIVQWDGIQPPLQHNLFDKVLLDAPCTGSGTFMSNPELKWRQKPRFLQRHIILQANLLKSALALLKRGGTLIYSTCSLYPEEGEYQIAKLSEEIIDFMKPPSWLPSPYTVNDSIFKGSGRFNPADHQTIGFFVSKMIKK